jgi:hypothetical protein
MKINHPGHRFWQPVNEAYVTVFGVATVLYCWYLLRG